VDAIERMREHGISCLPVVKDGRLIGIVTEHDFMRIARQLLEEKLRE
jgi:CBS domain-containing protein